MEIASGGKGKAMPPCPQRGFLDVLLAPGAGAAAERDRAARDNDIQRVLFVLVSPRDGDLSRTNRIIATVKSIED